MNKEWLNNLITDGYPLRLEFRPGQLNTISLFKNDIKIAAFYRNQDGSFHVYEHMNQGPTGQRYDVLTEKKAIHAALKIAGVID